MQTEAQQLSSADKVCITKDLDAAHEVLIHRLQEIPFYQKKFQACYKYLDLDGLLESLPIITKATLSEQGENFYAQPQHMIALFSETSGTTGGKPLLTPRGRDELRWNSYNQARAYQRHIRTGHDRIAILHPVLMSPFAEATALALHQLGIGYLRIFPIPKVCDYQRIARILADYKITAIMTTPTLAYKVLYELNQLGEMPPHLDKLLLTGETLTKACLSNFDRIIDHGGGVARSFVYGSSEAATLMYGEIDATYRGFLDDFIFEILPTKDPFYSAENPVSDCSVTGKLIVTWLQQGILPLIRFDTGDIFSVWQDAISGDWVFDAYGRHLSKNFSLAMEKSIEEIIFSASESIVHYDVNLYEEYANITCFTFDDRNGEALLEKELIENLAIFLQRKITIDVNPIAHPFREFSPLAKTNRIENIE